MAKILIHTSSSQPVLQNQGLRLQQELQILGHHVEYSTQTHPARILKNDYDVLHILSEAHELNFRDKSLLIAAKVRRLGVVVSSFEYVTYRQGFFNQFQFQFIDIFSTTDLASLNSHKALIKDKFILPFFPLNKNRDVALGAVGKSTLFLKVISASYEELRQGVSTFDFKLMVDASALTQRLGATQARKKWRKFLTQYPEFKKAILILQFENVTELFKNDYVLIDLSLLQSAVMFHSYLEWVVKYRPFVLLNKNQATGFPYFWKHQKNCWITDLHESTRPLKAVAKKFFKSKDDMIVISVEDKINELSRLYAKLMHERSLLYDVGRSRASAT